MKTIVKLSLLVLPWLAFLVWAQSHDFEKSDAEGAQETSATN